jgi:hypothetical protein
MYFLTIGHFDSNYIFATADVFYMLIIIISFYNFNVPNVCNITGGAVGCSSEIQAGRSRVLFPMVSFEFFVDLILPAEQ